MKFKIETPDCPDTVTLYLDQENKTVYLRAIDQEGDDWILLEFNENGSTILVEGLSPDLGFELDKNACLLISEN